MIVPLSLRDCPRLRDNALCGVAIPSVMVSPACVMMPLLLPNLQAPLLQATIPSLLDTLTRWAGLYGFAPPPPLGAGHNFDFGGPTWAAAHPTSASASLFPRIIISSGGSTGSSGEDPWGGAGHADLWPQVAHQAALHVLYVALGLLCCTERQPAAQGGRKDCWAWPVRSIAAGAICPAHCGGRACSSNNKAGLHEAS